MLNNSNIKGLFGRSDLDPNRYLSSLELLNLNLKFPQPDVSLMGRLKQS